MKRKDHIAYWVKTSGHDIKVMRSLFKEKKYPWCLFVGHLALEKLIKAIWVRDNQNQVPPKTHNLLRLAEETKLAISENDKLELLDINDFNLEVRYPDYQLKFYQRCNRRFTIRHFNEIQRIYING